MIGKHLPHLDVILRRYGIQYLVYFSDWLFTLFAKLIPVQLMDIFLDCFLKEGWTFFYKVCLSFFKALDQEIQGAVDRDDMLVMAEIISILKLQPSQEESQYRSPREESKVATGPQKSRRGRKVSDDDEMSVELESRMRNGGGGHSRSPENAIPSRAVDNSDSFHQQEDLNDEGTVKGFGRAVLPKRIRKSPKPSKVFSPNPREEDSNPRSSLFSRLYSTAATAMPAWLQ